MPRGDKSTGELFKEIREEFANAHRQGMQDLRNRDFTGLGHAIDQERAAIEKLSAIIGSGRSAPDRAIESVEAEHIRLTSRMEALEREHVELQRSPNDLAAHRRHRHQLQQYMAELGAHIERLRNLRRA